jgi:ElaB/YqjD/DUF883 family membrane-anchored ribosome-binding protein
MFDGAGCSILEASMTKNAESVIADFAEDFAALRKDVAHLAEAISQLAQHPTQVAGDAVEDAKSKIASAAEDAQTQVRAASSEIETNIKRNPLTAVLIAFGIGVALGVITRPRG